MESAQAFRVLLAEVGVLREQVSDLHSGLLGPRGKRGGAMPASPPGNAPTAALFGTLLGSFRLFRENVQLDLGGSKVLLDLCRYLVAHAGQLVSRDVLLELLWPDQAPAIHRLHVAISSLRRLLDRSSATESVVQMEDDGYRIAVDGVLTDCDLFDAHYERGKAALHSRDFVASAAAFCQALELYAGEYLADSPYAEWALPRRTHFAERRLSALTALCEFASDSGDLLAVLEHAEAILQTDSLRERAHRHVMRAHYAMGQRSCAIRQFHVCAELLGQELGVEPSYQTRSLYLAICSDAELPLEPPIF